MYRFFKSHVLASIIAGLLIVGAGYLIMRAVTYDPLASLITETIKRGTVENIVSVSGIMEAENTAELAFPSSGVVSQVYVKEGDMVLKDDVLATLGADSLVAERASALAELRLAEADRDELISGVRTEAQAVTATAVAIAEENLKRITTAESLAVASAKRSLLSDELTARSTKSTEDATPPIISGTYRCEETGVYTLEVFSSNADSGYSFRLSGLETGTFDASANQPASFGTCGLYALFDPSSKYSNSTWVIEIPNKSAPGYITNLNTLKTAETTAKNAISTAKQNVTLEQSKQSLENASPRTEARVRAEAKIAQASARIAQIDAQIRDRSIIAPFSGVVTEVAILPGETAQAVPVFTLLATDTFELIARIPEIDVTKIAVGQLARVIFDAQTDTILTGSVSYISPLPIQIDGVGYFEVKIILDEPPVWLRGGLNADVDIIIEEQRDVLRAPKRFVTTIEGVSTVLTLEGNTVATTTVETLFEGNDGFVVLSGIAEGTTIVAP